MRNTVVQNGPSGGGTVARRWSGQTIAGRSGVPSSRAQTTVPRWVVRATPAIRAGSTPPCQRARQASVRPCQYDAASFSAQPGCS